MAFLARLRCPQGSKHSDGVVLANDVKVLPITQRRQGGFFKEVQRPCLALTDLLHAGQPVGQVYNRLFLVQNADELNIVDAPTFAFVERGAKIAKPVWLETGNVFAVFYVAESSWVKEKTGA